MKKHIVALVLVMAVFLIVAGCGKTARQVTPGADPPAQENTGEETTAAKRDVTAKPRTGLVVEETYIVEVTNNGFNPNKITIADGDSVQFVAKDGGRHWPASAVHPSHQAYPGSDIGKCKGPEENTVFDACKILQEGQVFEFRFTEKGSWQYHDHLHPTLTGTVVVE